jgi:hypothetical protein
VTWRVRRWLTLGLDYTHNRYDFGTVSSTVATENRAGLRLIASF